MRQSSMKCVKSRSNSCSPIIGGWGAVLFLFFALLSPTHADDAGQFFLHDGDTVVFYGDSITEQQLYPRDIETYVLTRFPAWHVRFIDSGWAGDRVTGGEGGTIDTRIQRDILPYKPTVVTILLGMNDAAYTHFNQSAYDAYVQGLTQTVDTLRQLLPGVRLALMTPTFYDEHAPGSRHFHGYNTVLLKYGDFVRTLGAERGIPVIDLNAPLQAATAAGRKRDLRFVLVPDGVHPNEAGHLVLASAILQAWNAPGALASVALSPARPVTVTTPLPWPLPNASYPAYDVSPLPGALNAFHLKATGLSDRQYTLFVDNKAVGTFPRLLLESGMDISLTTALPRNSQSSQVLGLVQGRLDTWRYLWKGGPRAIARRDDAPTASETVALAAIDHWLDSQREQDRLAARPQAHTFTLRPAAALPGD